MKCRLRVRLDASSRWTLRFSKRSALLLLMMIFGAFLAREPDVAGALGERYAVTQDEVRDTYTGLTWQRDVDVKDMGWDAASDYCAKLELANQRWRLPALKELLTLVDPMRAMPAIDPSAFQATPADRFATASPSVDDPAQRWVVDFAYGDSRPGFGAARVRCVR